MINSVSTTDAPPPAGPYSQGLAVGGLVFLSGQGPFDENGNRVGETFAAERFDIGKCERHDLPGKRNSPAGS